MNYTHQIHIYVYIADNRDTRDEDTNIIDMYVKEKRKKKKKKRQNKHFQCNNKKKSFRDPQLLLSNR